jgi:hypothetical protein
VSASAIFSSWIVVLGVTIMITLMIGPTAIVKTFPVAKTFAQVQTMEESQALRTDGLLLQGVNATAPAGREEDIYSIPIEGDVYRITGEVFNNDTVRFSSVRVSAILLDGSNRTIGEGSAHTSPSGIQPGAVASFEINFFNTSVEGGIVTINNFTLHVHGNRQALTFR